MFCEYYIIFRRYFNNILRITPTKVLSAIFERQTRKAHLESILNKTAHIRKAQYLDEEQERAVRTATLIYLS